MIDFPFKKRITKAKNSSRKIAEMMGCQISKVTSELSDIISFQCTFPHYSFYLSIFLDEFTETDKKRIKETLKLKGLESFPVLVHIWAKGAKKPEEYWII